MPKPVIMCLWDHCPTWSKFQPSTCCVEVKLKNIEVVFLLHYYYPGAWCHHKHAWVGTVFLGLQASPLFLQTSLLSLCQIAQFFSHLTIKPFSRTFGLSMWTSCGFLVCLLHFQPCAFCSSYSRVYAAFTVFLISSYSVSESGVPMLWFSCFILIGCYLMHIVFRFASLFWWSLISFSCVPGISHFPNCIVCIYSLCFPSVLCCILCLTVSFPSCITCLDLQT